MHNNIIDRSTLKESLLKLNRHQLKLFYGMLVHAWASKNAFISKWDLFNLWCECNHYCAEIDEGFPNPYNDYELLRSFSHAHPYYFIDILPLEIIINLFCEHIGDRIDILTTIVRKLDTEGFRAAYEHYNAVLNLTDDIDESIAQAEEHIRIFS